MQTIPNRNALLVGGDMNCSLAADGYRVGTSKFTWRNRHCKGPQHADMQLLHQLLTRQDLVALNTWNATDAPTFQSGHSASRIDHFFMRHSDCDAIAKQTVLFPEAGFLQLNGSFHVPMLCSVRKIPFAFTHAAGISSCTYQQRLHSRSSLEG